MARITTIEGIGPVNATKLAQAGIKTTDALLKAGARPADRKQLAQVCDLSDKALLGWLNRADLLRIKGIGEEYSDLLELAGVDTVPALAQRNPDNLHAKIVSVNSEKNVVRKLPSPKQVTAWVSQAKELPRAIHY